MVVVSLTATLRGVQGVIAAVAAMASVVRGSLRTKSRMNKLRDQRQLRPWVLPLAGAGATIHLLCPLLHTRSASTGSRPRAVCP